MLTLRYEKTDKKIPGDLLVGIAGYGRVTKSVDRVTRYCGLLRLACRS